ncbi:YheC/YheD family protein [Shimazuella sp. AN120528]|uniref:YheC/YheD family endospore coat-associated protein n=1 Tax=Shimazuella soli TaxID=1892854 RepID=UPI001F0F16C6|nr:YheC/YheD family protein [Shimazuella soli]MCH5584332.1 YheC/YheD family protein [Shimazuella soli]
MNSIICQTQLSHTTPAKAIFMPIKLCDQFGFSNGQSIKVEIGSRSVITRIIATKTTATTKIIFTPSIARQLSLPYTGKMRVLVQNRTLKFGPVIGILTTGFQSNIATPFGGRTSLFRSFIQAGDSEKPIIYVFTPEMIDWQNRVVTAWYFRLGKWMKHVSPLPDVIYERIPNRKSENLAQVQNCISRLKTLTNCQIFNQGFFNKWSVHEWLYQNEETKEYIPETVLSPSIQTLQQMLEEHEMVYLKPIRGSLGLGIFRITYSPAKGYYCRFHGGERNVLHRFATLESLLSHYFRKNKQRFKGYLAQQGIRLIRIQNRPVDFRVHIHKDSSDDWKVVGIGSKLAGVGSVTTHVRTGGTLLSTRQLFEKNFGDRSEEMLQSLKDTAILIAEVLEENADGPLGEIGMDMGIDQDYRIWLFECNAKPGRHIFDHPSLREAGRQSAKCITDYSMKLAQFV